FYMANLLPFGYQRMLRRALWARFVVAGSAVAILCALVAFLALLPSYFSVRIGLSGVPGAPLPAAVASSSDQASLHSLRTLTQLFAPLVAATTTPTDAIGVALAARPSGIALDTITYTRDATGAAGQLVLSGSAENADAIAAYQRALSDDSRFSGVAVPVGAL